MSPHLVRAALLITLGIPVTSAAEIRTASFPAPGGARAFLVATPKAGVAAKAPLVLLFHGHMGSARNTLGQGVGKASPLSAWLDVVDREGVVVAALDGARGEDGKQGWNDGRPGNSGNPIADDVAFARGVVAQVQSSLGTDPARVYAMGMSNGGVFCFRLARELDLPLAAVAAVCASMPGDHAPAPPTRRLSVLMIEGDADPLMPYEGGQVHFYAKLRGAVLGTDATLAYWRAADGLTAPPREEALPHTGRDATRLIRRTWGEPQGPQVELLRVAGGGHCEPSRTHVLGWLYTKVCGPQNHDAEAAEEAWRFFRDKRALK